MNSFGRLFRVSIYGESHGKSIGVVIDGVPSGIELNEESFNLDIQRRKPGALGTTPRVEEDKVIIESGVFNGFTTGAPISLRFENNNTRSKDYSQFLETPRPSHADFTANNKYNGFQDYRGGGHFSGRLTLGLVACGVVAKKIVDFKYETKISNLKGVEDETLFESVIKEAIEQKDSIGGVVTTKVSNVSVGLGEPFFDSVESNLSHLLFSVGGVKGVSFGIGFDGKLLYGSEFNDKIIDSSGKTSTNNNGGINGGITNGNDIIINTFVKPTPSIFKNQETFNFKTNKVEDFKIEGRHDCAIILRAQVVIEAVIAIGLADLYLINRRVYG